MSTEIWSEIIAEYKEARHCLWCPKGSQNWSRNEDDGYYHLWRAYHLASTCAIKQPLWYARILFMMASEQRCKQRNYVILNRYLRPCMEAYAEAQTNGDAVSPEEIAAADLLYRDFLHEDINTSSAPDKYEKAYARIEGMEDIPEFQFHDSCVLEFSHDRFSARMSFQYDRTAVTLLFEDVYQIDMCSVDPQVTYISEFSCYPAFHNKDLIVFEADDYKILCRKVKVVSHEHQAQE